jgi:hypothetical protein
MNGQPVQFEGSAPIFRVENMGVAVDFYVNKLGFANAPWGTDEFTSVTRDRAGIYLCKAGQGRGGAWAWIGVEDAQKSISHVAYLSSCHRQITLGRSRCR